MCPETICPNQIFSQFSSQEQFGQLHWNFAHDAFWYQTELPAKHIIYFSIIVIFIIIFLGSFFLEFSFWGQTLSIKSEVLNLPQNLLKGMEETKLLPEPHALLPKKGQ